MFGTVLLVAVTAMHVYVFWRLGSLPAVRRRLSRRGVLAVAVLLWALLVLGRLLGHDGDGGPAVLLELLGMSWLGILFLSSLCLGAVDLAAGVRLLPSRWTPRSRALALTAGATLSVLALVQGLRAPVVEDFRVVLPGLPPELSGTVVVGISDTHLGALIGSRWLAARVRQIEEQKPDLVVLLGDIVEGHGGSGEALAPVLRGLSAPLGVWAVPGNHEGHRRGALDGLRSAGIDVLRNRAVQLRPGLVLAGVDSPGHRDRGPDMDGRVATALAGRPPGATLLLSHTPSAAAAAARAGVGLVLCGHTHGGQIWPFGYLVGLRYRFVEGQYDTGGTTVIVSRGAGTWGPRMRLWRPGQIVRVTLLAASGSSGAPAPGASRTAPLPPHGGGRPADASAGPP